MRTAIGFVALVGLGVTFLFGVLDTLNPSYKCTPPIDITSKLGALVLLGLGITCAILTIKSEDR